MDNSLLACSLTLARARQENSGAQIALQAFPSDASAMLRLRSDEPVTYAAWGTSLLGTLIDKQQFTSAIAGGLGNLTADSGSFRLRSWIPLKGRVALRDVPEANALDRVVILDTGPATRQLADRLTTRRGLTVTTVPLRNCLGPTAAERGIALEIAKLIPA